MEVKCRHPKLALQAGLMVEGQGEYKAGASLYIVYTTRWVSKKYLLTFA